MCGRIWVNAKRINPIISKTFGFDFNALDNDDLRPSQTVSVITGSEANGYQQVDANWGIKPGWAKKPIINAQIETAGEKPTFREAFAHSQCFIPFTGWYEWRDEGDTKKAKYLFQADEGQVLLMRGMLFSSVDSTNELVSLTTAATGVCEPYHHRMPVIEALGSEPLGIHVSRC